MDAAGVSGVAGNQELAADCVGVFAVHAGACFAAGGAESKALGVDRCCFVSCPF